MSSRRVRCALFVVLALSLGVAVPAGAQGVTGVSAIEGPGGIEGVVEAQGVAGAVVVLLAGVVLLTLCVGKLVSYLTRAAVRLERSLFALAIVFTGFEFDDTVLGLVLATGGLESVALGTALGTGLAIVGVTLALAAIVRPFRVDLPADYLVLFALAPFALVPFVLLGTLTFVHGVALVALSVLTFGYLIVREYQRNVPVFRSSELGEALTLDGGIDFPESVSPIPEDRLVRGRPNVGLIWLVLAGVSLVGIVFASMLLEVGSAVAVEGFGIEQTLFGATVLTAILTVEDVMLTLEPVRRGVPEIGVGNVIGSVLFSVTGNVGIIVLVGELHLDTSVINFHLPAIVVLTALSAYFLSRGRLRRWHGVVLGGLYVGYWIGAIVVYGVVPLSG